MGATPEELAEVDGFLSESKSLSASLPIWEESSRNGRIQAIWNIEDEHGISLAHLRFGVWVNWRDQPSVSVIFRNQPICRLDIKSPDVCEDNPLEAMHLDLPAKVCGSHFHSWPDNRHYVAKNGFGKLPVRRSVAPQLRSVEQMLPWLADEIGIVLSQEQRMFRGPTNHDLLGLI